MRPPTYGVADAAVCLRRPTASAVALVVHGDPEAVLEAHGLDGEAVVGAVGGAAPGLHAHVEGHLQRRQEIMLHVEIKSGFSLLFSNRTVLALLV